MTDQTSIITPVVTPDAPQAEPVDRRMFQLTDLLDNHNKFYLVELWPEPDERVRFRATWGRVGAKPQVKEKVTTRHDVERQVQEKLRKGYRPIDLHQPEIEVETPQGESAEPPLDANVSQLVEWVFTEAGEHIQSFLAVPVEALSQEQINEARKLLSQAQRQHLVYKLNPFKRSANMEKLITTVQAYYNAVPTRLPARMDREQVALQFCQGFNEQEERLLQLEAAIATMKVKRQRPDLNHYQSLGAEISLLPISDTAYSALTDYVSRTQVHGYKIAVREIFEVCIRAEREAYEKNRQGASRRELLFHGTRNQNVRHILRQGLICPQSPANGRMLGNGIYLANKVSKSANYCSSTRKGVPQMLLVVEAALGNLYIAPEAKVYSSPPINYDSVWGKAGHTKVGPTYTLANDEFVIYSPAQQTIRYLVTFERV